MQNTPEPIFTKTEKAIIFTSAAVGAAIAKSYNGDAGEVAIKALNGATTASCLLFLRKLLAVEQQATIAQAQNNTKPKCSL